MARLGARGHYQFSAETLVRWAQAPEALIVGARADDNIEAVSVFLVAGDQAEYHINGCTERGRNYAAWLIWNAIVRLRERGVTTLHLGGLYMLRTKVSEFTSLDSPARRDLVAELAEQCRKEGQGLFLYCPPDVARTEPQETFDRNCAVVQ